MLIYRSFYRQTITSKYMIILMWYTLLSFSDLNLPRLITTGVEGWEHRNLITQVFNEHYRRKYGRVTKRVFK
jgi:hypothetical protein